MAYKDKKIKKLKGKEWWDNNQDRIKAYRMEHAREHNEYSKDYHLKHREQRNEWARLYRRKNKFEVVRHYSKDTCKCSRCGYDDMRALQIDHISGGGEVHRRSITQDFYVWLIKNEFPQGFQVLCANCQVLKAWENKEHSPGRLGK